MITRRSKLNPGGLNTVAFSLAIIQRKLTKLSQDPIFFVRDILEDGNNLTPAQLDAIQAIHDNNKIMVVANSKTGLTSLSLAYILWFALTHPNKNILLLGPSHQYIVFMCNIVYQMFITLPQWVKDHYVCVEHHTSTKLEFSNATTIQGCKCDRSAARGKTTDLVFWDEYNLIHLDPRRDVLLDILFSSVRSGEEGKVICGYSTPNIEESIEGLKYESPAKSFIHHVLPRAEDMTWVA